MTLGKKHPWALGRPAREVWREIWDDIGPRIERVLRTGEATWDEGLLLFLERSGYREETYHTFSYSPLSGDDGGIAGHALRGHRGNRARHRRAPPQLSALHGFRASGGAIAEDDVLAATRELPGPEPEGPAVRPHLLFGDDDVLRLAAASGIQPGHPAAPAAARRCRWPLARRRSPRRQESGGRRGSRGSFSGPPHRRLDAAALPRGRDHPATPGAGSPRGLLRRRAQSLRAASTTSMPDSSSWSPARSPPGLANARAYEQERRRAEALAELDRAKTTFFSNVSHEFRTPLTLMLGAARRRAGATQPHSAAARCAGSIETVHRNGLRLLKLVNTLLDFSRIEAGRVQALLPSPPTSARSPPSWPACSARPWSSAGLRFIVDCDAAPPSPSTSTATCGRRSSSTCSPTPSSSPSKAKSR